MGLAEGMARIGRRLSAFHLFMREVEIDRPEKVSGL